MASQGLTMDMYYQFSGTDEKGLREELRESAEKRVKANLTLEAVADAENIEVTDEEVEEDIKKTAENFKMPVDQVKQLINMQGGTKAIKEDLRIRKAIDFLVDHGVEVPAEEIKEA